MDKPLETVVESQSTDVIDTIMNNDGSGDLLDNIDLGSLADIGGIAGGFLSGFFGRLDYGFKSLGVAVSPEVTRYLGTIFFTENPTTKSEAFTTLIGDVGKDIVVIGLAYFAGSALSKAKQFYEFMKTPRTNYR